MKKWLRRKLHLADHIGLGSLAISAYYPSNDYPTAAVLKNTGSDEAQIHFFDYMAWKHMDDAGARISTGIAALIKANEGTTLLAGLADALKRPIKPPAPTDGAAKPPIPAKEPDEQRRRRHRLTQYARVVFELIRVAHYLEIRPERWPGGPATRHHVDSRNLPWSTVFARYLDVPIQARKRPETKDSERKDERSEYIDGLVPSRSLRVDRLSQLYHVHLSSRALQEKEREGKGEKEKEAHNRPENADEKDGNNRREYELSLQCARKYPGHLALDSLIPGRELYWTPWDKDGVRPLADVAQGPVESTRLGTPLLGRFDRLIVEPAKNTARFRQFAPSMPYFRRQQIGLPFAAALRGDRIGRANEHAT